MELRGKNIVVVGLGVSGIAAAKFAFTRGAKVTACDNAMLNPTAETELLRQMGVQTVLGHNPDEAALKQADLIIISPGVPHYLPLFAAVPESTEIIGEIEFAARFIDTPIIAITGTNGKTTVTELTSAMLTAAGFRVFTGGNIGTPLISYVDSDDKADVIVAEVSSFQLDTIREFKPHIAAILNVTPDHLDRYQGSMQRYGEAKLRILMNQTADDYAVINVNDTFLRHRINGIAPHKLWFGDLKMFRQQTRGQGALLPTADKLAITIKDKEYLLDTSGFKLLGPHNRENLAAAALMALAFGAAPGAVERAAADFKPSAHRVELVAEIEGVRFVDDSKATNVDAVIRALDCFEGQCVLIMGGLDKGCDFNSLKHHVQCKAKAVVAIGSSRTKIEVTLGAYAPVTLANDMQDAVNKAWVLADEGDVILLSPACASFDMFTSYAHRGDEFVKAISRLPI